MNADSLHSALRYDPDTGNFCWNNGGRGKRRSLHAGTTSSEGYVVICIKGRLYKAHRLAWLYMTGAMPMSSIDHINGIRTDNRWINLRLASAQQQQQNRIIGKNNSSGYIGVSRWRGKWRAQIDRQYLGVFPTPEAAYRTYLDAKQRRHDFQPNGERA